VAAQETLEKAVAQALRNGASVRSVAELGLSANTVQKYGRAHGCPPRRTASGSTNPAMTVNSERTQPACPGTECGPTSNVAPCR